MEIDLNSDLGEGYGHDAELMPLVTSANISCGFHAGDVGTALAALRLGAEHTVRCGAHPGFPDREHFGRRDIDMEEVQVLALCLYQVGALAGLAKPVGLKLTHLKAHGALYNLVCREERYAKPLVRAAEMLDLPLLALPGSCVEQLCRGRVKFIAEGFADRRYQPDGSLVPRSQSDAFVTDPDEAVRQAEWLISERGVRSLCVHGDNPQALVFVRQLRDALVQRGHELRAFA